MDHKIMSPWAAVRILVCTAALAVGAWLTLGACGYDRENAQSAVDVRSRAGFDLHCNASSLKVTPLAEDRTNYIGRVVQYGVEGCGKQAVYVRTDSGWVLNAGSDTSKAP